MLKYELIPKSDWSDRLDHGCVSSSPSECKCAVLADAIEHDSFGVGMVNEAFGRGDYREYTDSQHSVVYTLRF